MARTVREILNRELLSVGPDRPVREVRDLLKTFAVGAVPVVDEARAPLGVLSLRDVLDDAEGTAAGRMRRPAICVADSTTIDSAARHLARTDMHHLVVVDAAGAATGMLSSMDLLRGLLGMPVRHPESFPHWDEEMQVRWTDEWSLDEEGCSRAPRAGGVLVLVCGVGGERDALVWAEECADIRERAKELASRPGGQAPTLARSLARPGIRARAAIVEDASSRRRIVHLLRDRIEHVPPPGAT